jgi:hypothetical protein
VQPFGTQKSGQVGGKWVVKGILSSIYMMYVPYSDQYLPFLQNPSIWPGQEVEWTSVGGRAVVMLYN